MIVPVAPSEPGADEAVKETPLPKLQLFLLLFLQLAEPITSTVIYPFVNQLVRETGVTGGDERKTGYFAGLIESSFYAVEAVCVLQWGRASDRVGRKPVLLCGLLGLALSMLGFGLARAYWAAVLARCAEGALNGNIGVAKSVMAEITDATNRARGFACLPMIWAVGGTLGPVIGGVFARPADRWPAFRKGTFWTTYPYFLPCVIAACISLSACVFVTLGLKETLPRAPRQEGGGHASLPSIDIERVQAPRRQERPPSHTGDITQEPRPDPASTPSPSTEPLKAEKSPANIDVHAVASPDAEEKPLGIRTILTARVFCLLLNYAFVALADQCVAVLVPLVYSTSVPLGGLGFGPLTIGVVQGVGGCVGGLVQVATFPRMHRTLGARRLYVCSYAMYVVVLAVFPLNALVTRRAGAAGAATWALVVVQYTAYAASYMTWAGCIFIYISDAAPNQKALGVTNGLAQTTASTVRAVAPSLASSLFSLSLERRLAGGTMVYWVLIGITLLGLVASRWLPATAHAERDAR
ncbi:MFS general substrate transporter [Trametes elegans]|nr:MFS general substrate transporter [Trametes elegans]